jgi:hypothetical protein
MKVNKTLRVLLHIIFGFNQKMAFATNSTPCKQVESDHIKFNPFIHL